MSIEPKNPFGRPLGGPTVRKQAPAPSRALAERLERAVELIGESDSVYVRDLIDVAEDAAALLREPEPEPSEARKEER